MNRSWWAGALVLVTSCAAISKQVSIGGQAPERQGSFSIVNIIGNTKEAATAALRASGVQGSIDVVDNYVCHDPSVAELRVCSTSPAVGATTSSRIPVTLYLRPKEAVSYVMPDVRGKTADEAKQILVKLGQPPDRFEVEEMHGWLDECEPSRVCRQHPDPGTTAYATMSRWLEIAPGQRPARPTPPAPNPDRAAPDAPKPDAPKPDAPKPPPPAAPPPTPIF